MKSKFVSVDIDIPFTPEQWLVITKKMAPRIFSESSASWFDEVNTTNINECLINAFINEMMLTILMDEIALRGVKVKKAKKVKKSKGISA